MRQTKTAIKRRPPMKSARRHGSSVETAAETVLHAAEEAMTEAPKLGRKVYAWLTHPPRRHRRH